MSINNQDNKEKLLGDNQSETRFAENQDDFKRVGAEVEPAGPKDNWKKAIILMNIALIFQQISMSGVRIAVNEKMINPIDNLFIRGTIMALFPLVKQLKSGFKFASNSFESKVLILRSIAMLFGGLLMSIGMTMIPQTYTITLLNLAPFFMSLILYFWTGEETSLKLIVCMVICFVMVVLILIYKPAEDEIYGEDSLAEPRFGNFTLGFFLVLLAVPFLGFVRASVRAMKHIDSIVMMTYQSMVIIPAQFIVIIIFNSFFADWGRIFNYDLNQWLWMIWPALFVPIQMLLQLSAMKSANPGLIGCLLYIGTVYALLIDFIIFHVTIVGIQFLFIMIILVANIYVAVDNYRSGKTDQATTV